MMQPPTDLVPVRITSLEDALDGLWRSRLRAPPASALASVAHLAMSVRAATGEMPSHVYAHPSTGLPDGFVLEVNVNDETVPVHVSLSDDLPPGTVATMPRLTPTPSATG